MQADLGLIGLAVMGQNLVLNMADHGFTVAVYNRTVSKVDEFLAGPAKGKKILGAHDLAGFVKQLKRPRRIMLMVKAGSPVDEFIDLLTPYLEKGDIIIDGGNSFYADTERRCVELKEQGFLFLGVGVSGGEEGARTGPSIMPGGCQEAWPHIKPIFQAIAAKSEEGEPCCDWVGNGGAGHYVKMVHNGIEYGDMQLICETYDLLHRGAEIDYDELARIFDAWNQGVLNSYLIEITAEILRKKDQDGSVLLTKILDAAGQKGTGKWTSVSAFDLGVPVTLIAEAVFARYLSSMKGERALTSQVYSSKHIPFKKDRKTLVSNMQNALYAAKITSYAQGFMLMRQASLENKWNLNFGSIALMWRGGCIIRSRFLGKIKEAFDRTKNLDNLLLDPFFVQEMSKSEHGWREVVAEAVLAKIPVPCISSALAFFDGYLCERLPANLLQAQRDFFGAHTYERVDLPRGKFVHTNWTGKGGDVSSSSYNA